MATRGEDDIPQAGSIKEGSDELTTFAPFEASRTVSTSLPYRGERAKPPQVEINDASYLGQPKVLFRKLRSTPAASGRSRGHDKKGGSPQPFEGSWGQSGAVASRRVRVGHVTGEHETGRSKRFLESGRSASARVTKSLVLNRLGTLGKDQVRVYTVCLYV